MEVLYGVIVLLAFILGLGIGLSVPFLVKKYVESLKKEEHVNTGIENNTKDKVKFVPNDLMMEWMTGEEVKPNEEQ